MFNCEKIVSIADTMHNLIQQYHNSFSQLDFSVEIISFKKISSIRSVHNLSGSVRPDLMSIDNCLSFFDWSRSWRKKKRNTYTICYDDKQRISCIYTAKKQFVEFYVYQKNIIILLGYSKQDNDYKLESVGVAQYKNNRIVEFSVAELENSFYPSHGFRLKTEEYVYDEEKIVRVVMYDYVYNRKITRNPDDFSKLGYIKMRNGGIFANPEIYIDDYTYSENGIMVRRWNFYNTDIPPAKIIVNNKA